MRVVRENLKMVAISVVVSSLFSAGAASAATYYWLSGWHIIPHTISTNRLTPATVTYLHHPGPIGPRGYTGAPGQNGTAIVSRVTVNPAYTNYTFPGGTLQIGVAQEGGTWTQAATEDDLLFGQLRYDSVHNSSECVNSSNQYGTANVYANVYLDTPSTTRQLVAYGSGPLTGGATQIMPLHFVTGIIPGTGAAVSRNLSVWVSSECDIQGNITPEPFQVPDMTIDVVRAH